MATARHSFLSTLTPRRLGGLFKDTFNEWLEDKAPQLGAALAFYTMFSLAPLVLVLLAAVGFIFRHDPAGAWEKISEHLGNLLDRNAVQVVRDVAARASEPGKSALASVIGIALALFGASGVFGQLQDALNTIWGVKAKPGAGISGFIRMRFLSFSMVAGVCFLMLVSLTVDALLKGFGGYLEGSIPGGAVVAWVAFSIFDLVAVVFLFALMFKYLPDVIVQWRDVWVGAVMTALLFIIGKWALGLYLASGAAGSAYGAASSLVTLLIWIYYSSQILLFGAEFTQVYANKYGGHIEPNKYAVLIATEEVEISGRGTKEQ